VGLGHGVRVGVAVGVAVGGADGGGGRMLAKFSAVSFLTISSDNKTRYLMFKPTLSGAFALNTAKMIFCSFRMPSS
jgi:hypothetical protein